MSDRLDQYHDADRSEWRLEDPSLDFSPMCPIETRWQLADEETWQGALSIMANVSVSVVGSPGQFSLFWGNEHLAEIDIDYLMADLLSGIDESRVAQGWAARLEMWAALARKAGAEMRAREAHD